MIMASRSQATGNLLALLVERSQSTAAFAMLLVLDATGSTPGKAGGRAIVDAEGKITGTIGGGRVEAEAIQRALAAIQHRRPEVFEVPLQGRAVGGNDPICGGSMRVLVDLPTPAAIRTYATAAQSSSCGPIFLWNVTSPAGVG